MLRNRLLLNIILFVIIVFLGIKLYSSLAKPMPEPSNVLQKQTLTQEQNKKEIEALDSKKDLYDNNVIVQKDLFRQTRSEPLPDEVSKQGNPSMPPPKLVGITMIGDETKAFLEDPLTKTTRPYRAKDSIAGFTIKEIHNDKVILLRGSEKVEVGLIKVKTIDNTHAPSNVSQPMPNVQGAGVPPSPVQPYQQFLPQQPSAPTQQVLPQPQVLMPPKPVYIPPRQAGPLPPVKNN